jgi:hypothetical protein
MSLREFNLQRTIDTRNKLIHWYENKSKGYLSCISSLGHTLIANDTGLHLNTIYKFFKSYNVGGKFLGRKIFYALDCLSNGDNEVKIPDDFLTRQLRTIKLPAEMIAIRE